MTIPANATGTAQPKLSLGVVKRFFGLVEKSMEDGVLRDIEDIDSSVMGHVESHEMPTRAEVYTGPAQAMRGGQADTQVSAHATLHPQSGESQMAIRFNDMILGEMAKARKDISALAKGLKTITESIQAAVKAEKDEETEAERMEKARVADLQKAEKDEKDKKDAMEKAVAAKAAAVEQPLRKARFAIRKAEDAEDDEHDDAMEKAEAALATAAEAIGKAEDEAEDDGDEKRAEKARADLRTLKSVLAKRKVSVAAKREAAKAVASGQKPAVSKDELSLAIADLAKSKGMTVPEMFKTMDVAVGAVSDGGNVIRPPVFAKAVETLTPDTLNERLHAAMSNEHLSQPEIAKASSLVGRFARMKVGGYDSEALLREIEGSTPGVQALFAVTPIAA